MKSIFTVILLLFFGITFSMPGDSALILSDERFALDVKLQFILQAQNSVSMSYYAINEDEVGLQFAAAACMKAQEGLRVQMVIEKSRSKVSRQMIRLLIDHGVDIRYYNTFSLAKTYKNFSWLHDKLLVTDSLYVVTGGRNLNNKYYPSKEAVTELVDIETAVKGKSGEDAQRYIHHLMQSRFTNTIKIKRIDSTHYLALKRIIDSNILAFRSRVSVAYDSLFFPVREAGFYRDNYKKWPKSKRVAQTVLTTLQQADSSITIVSPYLIPPVPFMKALKKASRHGVEITLISNAPQISDAPIIAAAYMNDRRKYLKRGIKVYEYNGTRMLHDKLFLVDDSIAVVGSYNFDNISYRMNSENIIRITDIDFGKKIQQHIASRMVDCFKVEAVRDKNPYNSKAITRRTRWNRILLRVVPFIRRFL